MSEYQIGDEIIFVNPTFHRARHTVFMPGDLGIIISVEEYPAGSGRSLNPNCVVARIEKGGRTRDQWVDMEGISPVVTEEDVEGAIQSILGGSHGEAPIQEG